MDSLTILTKKVFDLTSNVVLCQYWTYGSKNIQNIYVSIYTNEEV